MKLVNYGCETVNKAAQKLRGVQPQKSKITVQKAIERHITSSSGGDKEAFDIIDTYIQKIAKQKYKPQKGVLYEDFLQDLRLKFLEIVNNKQTKGLSDPNTIMQEIVTYAQSLGNQGKSMVTTNVERFKNAFATSDFATNAFEKNDLLSYITNLPALNHIARRDSAALKMLVEGKTIDEIATHFGLTKKRAVQVLKDATEKANRKFTAMA